MPNAFYTALQNTSPTQAVRDFAKQAGFDFVPVISEHEGSLRLFPEIQNVPYQRYGSCEVVWVIKGDEAIGNLIITVRLNASVSSDTGTVAVSVWHCEPNRQYTAKADYFDCDTKEALPTDTAWQKAFAKLTELIQHPDYASFFPNNE